MRWSELDDAGIWALPAERSKNKRSHTIALPSAALAIIASVPHTERDHLFGSWGAGFTSWPWRKQEPVRPPKVGGTRAPAQVVHID